MPYANTIQIQPYNVDPTASYTFGNVVVTSNVTIGSGLFWSNGAAVSSGGLNKASYGISTLFGSGY